MLIENITYIQYFTRSQLSPKGCKLLSKTNIPSVRVQKCEEEKNMGVALQQMCIMSSGQIHRHCARAERGRGSARQVLSEIYARQFGFFFFFTFFLALVCRRHRVLNAFQLISQILFRSCCGRSACKPCVGGGSVGG